MPSVNPEILSWARETAGLSLEEAAEKLGIHD
jgi:cytoskeletal protein RodZ